MESSHNLHRTLMNLHKTLVKEEQEDNMDSSFISPKCSQGPFPSGIMTPVSPSRVALVAKRRKPFNSPMTRELALHSINLEELDPLRNCRSRASNEILSPDILTRKSTVNNNGAFMEAKRARLEHTFIKDDSCRYVNLEERNYRSMTHRKLPLHLPLASNRDCNALLPLQSSWAFIPNDQGSLLSKRRKIPQFSISKIYSNPIALVGMSYMWSQFLQIERDDVHKMKLNEFASSWTPTTFLETSDMIFIKYEKVNMADKDEAHQFCRHPKANGNGINDFIKSLSDSIKWLFGIKSRPKRKL